MSTCYNIYYFSVNKNGYSNYFIYLYFELIFLHYDIFIICYSSIHGSSYYIYFKFHGPHKKASEVRANHCDYFVIFDLHCNSNLSSTTTSLQLIIQLYSAS